LALDGGEWSTSHPDRFTPEERVPGTKLGGPQSLSERGDEEKKSFIVAAGSDVGSGILYQLRSVEIGERMIVYDKVYSLGDKSAVAYFKSLSCHKSVSNSSFHLESFRDFAHSNCRNSSIRRQDQFF